MGDLTASLFPLPLSFCYNSQNLAEDFFLLLLLEIHSVAFLHAEKLPDFCLKTFFLERARRKQKLLTCPPFCRGKQRNRVQGHSTRYWYCFWHPLSFLNLSSFGTYIKELSSRSSCPFCRSAVCTRFILFMFLSLTFPNHLTCLLVPLYVLASLVAVLNLFS